MCIRYFLVNNQKIGKQEVDDDLGVFWTSSLKKALNKV